MKLFCSSAYPHVSCTQHSLLTQGFAAHGVEAGDATSIVPASGHGPAKALQKALQQVVATLQPSHIGVGSNVRPGSQHAASSSETVPQVGFGSQHSNSVHTSCMGLKCAIAACEVALPRAQTFQLAAHQFTVFSPCTSALVSVAPTMIGLSTHRYTRRCR